MSDSGAGLRGVVAGQTALSSVGEHAGGLTYRGYGVAELAELASFEEVAFLLLYTELPNAMELTAFKERLKTNRELPPELRTVLELLPASAHPMDVLRTGCSALGSFEPELEETTNHSGYALAVCERLLATLPGIICYWYHFSHHGRRITTNSDAPSIAAHFLQLLRQGGVNHQESKIIDVSLILYAEHEFNASTFAARVCASTLSDIYSAVTAAIGTLRGPLHGGANEKAMELISSFSSPEQAVTGIKAMLAKKDKIMGFGHAVYRTSDPRNAVIKLQAKKLAVSPERANFFAVSEAIENVMWEEKKLFPNADFYHAAAYSFLGIPTKLFTPIFVCSRVTGWCAHILEQRGNNRIIRPSADYIGVGARSVAPLVGRAR